VSHAKTRKRKGKHRLLTCRVVEHEHDHEYGGIAIGDTAAGLAHAKTRRREGKYRLLTCRGVEQEHEHEQEQEHEHGRARLARYPGN